MLRRALDGGPVVRGDGRALAHAAMSERASPTLDVNVAVPLRSLTSPTRESFPLRV
jgi:hypothetical protein